MKALSLFIWGGFLVAMVFSGYMWAWTHGQTAESWGFTALISMGFFLFSTLAVTGVYANDHRSFRE
jgi:hypothetical protein